MASGLISEFAAFPGQMIVINLAGITDSPAHLQSFQRLVTAVFIFGDVHHNIVGMKLWVQRSAGIMRKAGIDDLTGYLIIPGHRILSLANTDCGKFFQFTHSLVYGLFMSLNQPPVKKRDDGNGLRSRTLKVIKPDPASHSPFGQLFMRQRIDVPLKQAELFRTGRTPE